MSSVSIDEGVLACGLFKLALHAGRTDRRRRQRAASRHTKPKLTVGRREKMTSSCRSTNTMMDNAAAVSTTFTMTNVDDCRTSNDEPGSTDVDALLLLSSSGVKSPAATLPTTRVQTRP